MDRNEKLQFQQSIENYFEEKRVYDLFEKLLKELVINKPKEPIDYLIKRIKQKDIKRIFITGSAGTDRKEISLSLAEFFGYSCISLGDLIQKEITKKLEAGKKIEKKINIFNLVEDELVIDLLKKELIKLEKDNVSYIVEGFPRNRVQAMFLQSVGLLPDNVIVLTSSRQRSEERIQEKLIANHKDKNFDFKGPAKQSVDESDLNLNSVKEVFKGFFADILTSDKTKSSIIEEIARIVKYKNKTHSARKPPKILLLGPPCSKKFEIADTIAKKYNICHISISELLNKEIREQNDNSTSILNSMNQGDLVNDKFIFKLLEDRLYSSDCMINGWILTGYPKNSVQMNYFEHINSSFKPSLIVIVDLDDEVVQKRSSMRRFDPATGKIFYINNQDFAKVHPVISGRLVTKNEDKEEVLNKRLDNWKKFSNAVLAQNLGNNVLRLNGDSNLEQLVENISDAMENSS